MYSAFSKEWHDASGVSAENVLQDFCGTHSFQLGLFFNLTNSRYYTYAIHSSSSMQTCLPLILRSAVDSFLRTVPRQPRQLRYSSTNSTNQPGNHKPTMAQEERQTDAGRRPKKLICKSKVYISSHPSAKDPTNPSPTHTNLKLTSISQSRTR